MGRDKRSAPLALITSSLEWTRMASHHQRNLSNSEMEIEKRRTAIELLNKLEKKSRSQRSDKEKACWIWAKSVVSHTSKRQGSISKQPSKRQRFPHGTHQAPKRHLGNDYTETQSDLRSPWDNRNEEMSLWGPQNESRPNGIMSSWEPPNGTNLFSELQPFKDQQRLPWIQRNETSLFTEPENEKRPVWGPQNGPGLFVEASCDTGPCWDQQNEARAFREHQNEPSPRDHQHKSNLFPEAQSSRETHNNEGSLWSRRIDDTNNYCNPRNEERTFMECRREDMHLSDQRSEASFPAKSLEGRLNNRNHSEDRNYTKNSKRKRKNALRYLNKFGNIPTKELSERDKGSLQWAQSVIDQHISELTLPTQINAIKVLKRLGKLPEELLSVKNKDSLKWARSQIHPDICDYVSKNHVPEEHEKITATRILKKLKKIPAEQLSEKEKMSLNWAEIVTAFNKTVSKSNNNCHPVNKKEGQHKSGTNNSTNPEKPPEDVPNDNLIAVVIDQNHAKGAITPRNWQKVEASLAQVFLKVLEENPGPVPICRDGGWHQGHIKMIVCADKRSFNLYKKAISRVGQLWKGSKLSVVSDDYIAERPWGHVSIPEEPADRESIINIIRLSNPLLPTRDWKIGKVDEPKGCFRQAVIIVNNESLEPLKQCDGVISYGFGSVTIQINDQKGPAPENNVIDIKVEKLTN